MAAVFKILGLGALILLFNAYPERVGVIVSWNDPSSFVPLLGPEFEAHMPWLNFWWSLALVLAVDEVVRGRGYAEQRWVHLGVSLLGLYALGRLVFGGPLIGLDPVWMAERDVTLVDRVQGLLPVLNVVAKFALGLALLALLLRLGEKLDRALGRPS
jgi:hypothetical protein